MFGAGVDREADGRVGLASWVAPGSRAGLRRPWPQRQARMSRVGTAAIMAMAAAAPAAVTTARVNSRRRARLRISSKVPGGGGNGRTWAFSQASRSSCGSVTGFSSALRSRARAWNRSALMVPSGRPSIAATSRSGKPA